MTLQALHENMISTGFMVSGYFVTYDTVVLDFVFVLPDLPEHKVDFFSIHFILRQKVSFML